MINYQDGQDIKSIITAERKIIQDFKFYESNIKLTLETYTKEFDNISFENEVLKIMILNNFDNAIMQVDSNLQDIESLSNVLDILENQENISSSDIETYNKLFSKVEKDIKLIQNFIQKTLNSFDNVQYTGSSQSLLILDKCKDVFSLEVPTSSKDSQESKKVKEPKKAISKSIKKDFDFNTSDLLCFFPKSKSENLVISTMQDNYKISFKQNQAQIYIKDENFNISLNTPGVQVSNSKTNNILFVSHSNEKYTIITNNQIEIPNFIQVSKISKNEDFLEVEFAVDTLNLSIQDNIIYFEQEQEEKREDKKETKKVDSSIKNKIAADVLKEENITPSENNEPVKSDTPYLEDTPTEKNTIKIIEPEDDIDSFEEEEESELEKDINKYMKSSSKNAKHLKEEVEEPSTKQSTPKNDIPVDDDEITDNDTLIISDSSQKVTLPYTIADLEEKMKKNKKYKTLQDVIKNEYTIPLDTFKNPVKSRFREAFQLIKKKEHGSLKEAIGLGFELMFQSDLNPAVIAACRDLDELDIYLDCLDDNELDKFSCFKIEYNVKPTKNSKR